MLCNYITFGAPRFQLVILSGPRRKHLPRNLSSRFPAAHNIPSCAFSCTVLSAYIVFPLCAVLFQPVRSLQRCGLSAAGVDGNAEMCGDGNAEM